MAQEGRIQTSSIGANMGEGCLKRVGEEGRAPLIVLVVGGRWWREESGIGHTESQSARDVP
ncbi:hypothetical protein CVT26_011443 [Gymnopilus dilepis]|uniref:Uncharacterized protein n=1 Tax=Gymnopilus dilepis TaxID=231916 RepID=A0A409YQJ9_9AGAR|nr:hypothetical protein CVT26_011443 [Gymnopilus dilepis]